MAAPLRPLGPERPATHLAECRGWGRGSGGAHLCDTRLVRGPSPATVIPTFPSPTLRTGVGRGRGGGRNCIICAYLGLFLTFEKFGCWFFLHHVFFGLSPSPRESIGPIRPPPPPGVGPTLARRAAGVAPAAGWRRSGRRPPAGRSPRPPAWPTPPGWRSRRPGGPSPPRRPPPASPPGAGRPPLWPRSALVGWGDRGRIHVRVVERLFASFFEGKSNNSAMQQLS